ncbi:uncharacterized protein LOC110830660 [Zootermopsis nevadensis]|uniref:uncharacterized protein LOC110830660 n=1 Tax=Zootermopsis nevadensis TaxID=136037 RepID=UPI000B8E4EB5|nr:uncharacterized protein LOC110830660 [Zootermopsis nevadensis]
MKGSPMCAHRRVCAACHVLWNLVYVGAGIVQLVAGIFFLISLPIFKMGSNIWAGAWNIVVGIGGAMLSCIGDLTAKKQEALLFLTVSIFAINVVNIVILEIGEWHFFMTSNIQEIIGQKNLKKLVFYARVTTSISTAVAIVTSFLDSQFTFCSIQRSRPPKRSIHEQVSDIEYILPRKKPNSVGKQAHNIYSQYAQSWVFETDTAGSSKNESPYLKLPNVQVNEGNKTINLKNNKSARIDVHRTHNNEPKTCVVNPIVRVEQVSEESNGDRSLNYMKSFSRTPSPAALSESSSQDSNTNLPIYECLERLTEPALYRSRLNTAISLNAESSNIAVSPKPARPRSEIFTKDRLGIVEGLDFNDKVQYASLMVELQQTFLSKKKMFQQPTSPQSASESVAMEDSPEKTYSESKGSSCQESSQDDSQRTGHKGSDAEFCKELEAALQLIQDLESPNTIETPSETCKSIEEVDVVFTSAPMVCVQWENSECASPVPEDITSQGNSTAELQDIKLIAGVQEPSNIPSTSNKNSINMNNVKSNNNNIYKRVKRVLPPKMLLQDGVDTMNEVSTAGCHSQSAPSSTRWTVKSLLRKKTSLPMFAPELESAIFKSESLAYLTELELLARHARNKSIQRQIEFRVHQQILRRSAKCFTAKEK